MPKDPLDLLQPGERVVWTGRPSRYRARLTDGFIVALAACWVVVAAQSARDFALPALPFTLFAVYLLTARFVVRMVSLRQARYLLTDRRLVLTGGLTGQAVVTANLARLPNPVVAQHLDGSGDLAFGHMPSFWNPTRWRWRYRSFRQRMDRDRYRFRVIMGADPLVPPRLLDIPDVADVAALILATQQKLRSQEAGSKS